MSITLYNNKLKGTVVAPGSKSFSQRALAAGLLSGGGRIENIDASNDTRSAQGVVDTLRSGGSAIDIGESGLSTRLFTPIAATFARPITITGHGSILQRPMDFMESTITQLGATFESTTGFLPVTVCGPIKGGQIVADGSHGSQFITGLLFALPLAKEDSVLIVNDLQSKPYIDMTLEVLAAYGIKIRNIDYCRFEIKGNQHYTPSVYTVEGDWSGASCLLVAGAVAGQVSMANLNEKSLQADRAIVNALEMAGAKVEWSSNVLTVSESQLRAFEFDATHCPDLFPALAVLASACEGESKIIGTQRLTHKESDRATALKSELAKAGVAVDLTQENVMRIVGQKEISVAQYDAWNDHRIAMATAVLALRAGGQSTLTGENSVKKSYPQFWDDLHKLQQR